MSKSKQKQPNILVFWSYDIGNKSELLFPRTDGFTKHPTLTVLQEKA